MTQPTISHTLPGRIRLRHAASLSTASLEALTARVRSVAPSAMLTHNPGSRGTLILFDEKDASSRVVALFLPTGRALRRDSGLVGLPRLSWPHMRQIKRGMTVSLVVSLGLLVARRESGHAVAGGIFLGLLTRHLLVYRQRIWK
jgi:hypothetical protein